jgi:hypothetical protein
MKQVKNLILAAFLACALSTGVQAGDMGSPGIRCTTPPPPCNPNDPCTTSTSAIDDLIDPVIVEIALALVRLI